MTRDEFAILVQETLDDLPPELARHLDNVAVMIEDEPETEALRALGLNPRRDTLFGLYQGTPLTQRRANHGNVLPDTIHIFYRPLLRACRTPQRLRKEIRATVIHEIGHYFGLSEEAIRRLGY